MDSLRKKFGVILREHRKKAGLTQEALGIDAERDRSYISMLERGVQQPSLETIFALCDALGTQPSAIMKELEKRR